jgi:metal-sulfur cluster biosynthetic enzyme
MDNPTTTQPTPATETSAQVNAGGAPAPQAAGGVPAANAGETTALRATPDEMREAMKEIFDPEIPINIVDLGLIYKLDENDGKVAVEMTLTSPHCPVGDQLKARVNDVLTKCKGVGAVDVKLVFEPPWSKDKMTFEGKLQASMLGIM